MSTNSSRNKQKVKDEKDAVLSIKTSWTNAHMNWDSCLILRWSVSLGLSVLAGTNILVGHSIAFKIGSRRRSSIREGRLGIFGRTVTLEEKKSKLIWHKADRGGSSRNRINFAQLRTMRTSLEYGLVLCWIRAWKLINNNGYVNTILKT